MSIHTFETMGTVLSLRADNDLSEVDLRAVQGVFERYDRTYSLYKKDSLLSRVASGDLKLADTPDDVRETYATALEWRDKTGGLFTPHRPDGVIDLSGIVKALAIRDAGALLDGAVDDWLLTVGGDCLARTSSRRPTWNIGIADPTDPRSLAGVATAEGSRRALATSGIAERGDHIWSSNGLSFFAQATVAATDIITADVLATAIIAGLPADLDRLTAEWDVDVLTVDRDRGLRATSGGRVWIASSTGTPSE